MDCIFCKIVAGDIPAYKIYEDEQVLAFLDITPVNPGHTLVIPKKHYDNFIDLPEVEAGEIIGIIKKISLAVLAGVGAQGFNLNLNNGAVAGQVVNHIHWHIIPRFGGDNKKLWSGQAYDEGVAEKIAEKIKNSL